MRLEIENLRHQQQQNQRILAAFVSIDKSEQIIEQLRGGETIENITDILDTNTSYQHDSPDNTSSVRREPHRTT